MHEGFNDIKMATILTLLIVGIFMIPSAFGKTSEAILNEYQPTSNQAQKAQEFYSYDEPPRSTPSPPNEMYGQIEEKKELSTPDQSSGFCPYCGAKLPEPNAQYCANCGERVQ
jgi:NADH pyrophosphatase NudC (nudix superfamily)